MAKTDGQRARPVTVTPDVQDQFTLVRAFRAGDGSAFEQLQSRLKPVVLATIHDKGLGDSGQVEDLLGDVWLRVARGLQGFRFKAAPTTWVRSIAANVCNDHLRNVKRERQAQDAAREIARQPEDDGADEEPYTDEHRRAARQLAAINRLIESGMPRERVLEAVWLIGGLPARDSTPGRKARALTRADANALKRAADVLERREREWEAHATASGLDLSLLPSDHQLIAELRARARRMARPIKRSSTYRNGVLAAICAHVECQIGRPMEADIAAALGISVEIVHAVRKREKRHGPMEERLRKALAEQFRHAMAGTRT